MPDFDGLRIAAIVPCYNEEVAIAEVVESLRAAIPSMDVYVYDNNSKDATADRARAAGAIVRFEGRQGKGNVIRRAFADVDADVYVLIDGDATYDAAALPEMVNALLDGPLDHVLGVRREVEGSAYRPGHALGNKMFNRLVSGLFGEPVTDMLSGFRVFSRRFIKSFVAESSGFETETELTIHAMNLRVPQVEVPVGFRDRPAGSESKLRTYHDGFRILGLIATLIRIERPRVFFLIWTFLFAIVGVAIGIPVIVEFAQTGLVSKLPSAVLAVGFVLLAALALVLGFIMTALKRSRDELKRLTYLSYPPTIRSARAR
ncbi:MAG: glycosyltransferase [Microbacteriaceae bacterium]|nr:glycosyltransferase [Microbacteriaceae bacterium]